MRIDQPVRYSVLLAVSIWAALTNAWAKPDWLRVATDEVVIISDASPKVVAEYAVKYSAFRQTFNAILAPTGHRPTPIVVVLFKDEEELAGYLSKSGAPGSTVTARIEVDNAAMLALADSARRDVALALAYEYDTAWSLRRAGYFLPLWMTQGVGGIMASLRIKKGECIIDGKPNRAGTAWRADKALPWERFFEIDRESPEYAGRALAGVYQAQALALMNRVMLQEGKPREKFERLAQMIQEQKGNRHSVEETLGVPPGTLETTIAEPFQVTRAISNPFDEQAIRSRLKIEPADVVELLVRLSDLLIAYSREREGNEFLDKAAELSPQAVIVTEALARRELRRRDQSEAAKFYRIALAAGSVNTNALLISATERLDQTKSFGADLAGGGSRSTMVALEEIHRALELDRGDMNAWRLLGRAYFVAEKASAEGTAELSHAVSDEPNGLQVRYYRGMLYSRLGKTAEAMADLDYLVVHPRTAPALRASATAFKIQVQFVEDQQTVEKLVPEGRYEEAHRVLDRGIERSSGTSSVKDYRDLLDWVQENESWTKTVHIYQQQDWNGALAAVDIFIETYPKSTLSGEARQLKAGAEDYIKRSASRTKEP